MSWSGAACSQTSFRGATIGMTAADAEKQISALGFRLQIRKMNFGPHLILSLDNKNGESCGYYTLEAKWKSEWDSKFNEVGTLMNGAMILKDIASYSISEMNFNEKYFEASSVDVRDFMEKFEAKYEALTPLKLTRQTGGFYVYEDTGRTVLKGGEEVLFSVPPEKVGGFSVEIKKASASQMDAARQIDPKF